MRIAVRCFWNGVSLETGVVMVPVVRFSLCYLVGVAVPVMVSPFARVARSWDW